MKAIRQTASQKGQSGHPAGRPAAADTVRGQLISRNGNRMKRFEGVLDLLPKGHAFNGQLVVLDDGGHPLFNKLLFGRCRPTSDDRRH